MQLEHAGDAAGLALGRQEDRAVADLSVEHARDRHLAAVRGVQRLDHIGDRIVAGLEPEPLRGLGDPGRLVAQRLHQPQHAIGAGGGADQHRTRPGRRAAPWSDRRRSCPRRRDVLEQLLHQLVVVIGERLQHLEARCPSRDRDRRPSSVDDFGRRVLLVDVGPLQREIDEAGDDVAVDQIGICRSSSGTRDAGCSSASVSRTRLSTLSILFRNRKRGILSSSSSRRINCKLRNFLFVGLAHHDGGIDHRQRGAHVVHELDRAGTVDERVGVAHEASWWRPRARRSCGDGAPPCWRRPPWSPPPRCPAAGSRRCARGSLRAAWSCRSGKGPPARCTVDPKLVCRSVPFPPPSDRDAAFLRAG